MDESVDMDAIVVGGLEPATWYYFVRAQIDLLSIHVHDIEEQIDKAIKAYQSEKEATQVEHDDDGYPTVVLEEHREIEAPPDHLEEIFEYYFPNLLRRGTLITLFSFFEHELNQLCELFATTQKMNVVQTDSKDRGIDRSRHYLKKVMPLPIANNSVIWQEIKSIQKVRNVVVHNDAKLDPKADDKGVIEIVKRAKYLSLASENDRDIKNDELSVYELEVLEVNILEGYLTHVLDTCDSYCSELNKAIELSEPSII